MDWNRNTDFIGLWFGKYSYWVIGQYGYLFGGTILYLVWSYLYYKIYGDKLR